eukprot:2667354-Pleurochrysis_carterae.AAC.1
MRVKRPEQRANVQHEAQADRADHSDGGKLKSGRVTAEAQGRGAHLSAESAGRRAGTLTTEAAALEKVDVSAVECRLRLH